MAGRNRYRITVFAADYTLPFLLPFFLTPFTSLESGPTETQRTALFHIFAAIDTIISQRYTEYSILVLANDRRYFDEV